VLESEVLLQVICLVGWFLGSRVEFVPPCMESSRRFPLGYTIKFLSNLSTNSQRREPSLCRSVFHPRRLSTMFLASVVGEMT
jgi:hypothetical protein